MSALGSLQVDSVLSYLIAFVIPALDAVFPVLPGESAIIALGVATAGSADPRIALLIGCAAAGAFVGDNLCYLIGRYFSPWVSRHVFSGERGIQRRTWAERTLARYGARIIVACRFIPGGRTAVTLTCGVTNYRHRTFLWATALAGVIWASYAFFIGRISGKTFERNPWLSLVVALGVVLLVSGMVELARRVPGWWRRLRGGTTS